MFLLTFSLELYLLCCVSWVFYITIKLKSMIKNEWAICCCGTHDVQCQHGVSLRARRAWTRPSLQDRSCSSLCFTFCNPPPFHLHSLLCLCRVGPQTTVMFIVSGDPYKVNEWWINGSYLFRSPTNLQSYARLPSLKRLEIWGPNLNIDGVFFLQFCTLTLNYVVICLFWISFFLLKRP